MTRALDLALVGGSIFTGDPMRPGASCVAVQDGRIAAIGSYEEVTEAFGRPRETIELGGRAVLPGFHDAHCHPLAGALESIQCAMGETKTAADCLAAVAGYVASHPDAAWVVGSGWLLEAFPGGSPTADMLDAVCGGRPAFLENRDGHSAWVSTRALELAGIDASTPDPPHGRIDRDERGRPSGTLHEGAMSLVGRLVPRLSAEESAAALAVAQRHLFSVGVTGWQDAAVDEAVQLAYEALAGSGSLKARARLALWWDRNRELDQITELVGRRDRLAAMGLDARSVKMMVDGVLETYTAALLEPYCDPSAATRTASTASGCHHDDGDGGHGSGTLFVEPELAKAAVVALAHEGFQVHFHAIGDAAVRVALDAVEQAETARRPSDDGGRGDATGSLRHHIAHLQLVHPDDVGRFASLGVVANAQPFWACKEPQMTELTIPVLGPVRAAWQYPFASVEGRGAALAGGSDWPVSTANPLEEIAVAVRRVLPESARDGHPPEDPFLPQERIALSSAFRAFTMGSAYVNHLDHEVGSIEVGKLADLVVLEHDPFTIDVDRLGDAKVSCTIVGGEAVYEDLAR